MELTGELIRVFPVKEISETFSKRDVVVRTDGDYPQEICVELHKDRSKELTETDLGKIVNLNIELRGREWKGNDKWFNSVVAWKVSIVKPSLENPAKPPF
jgi:hypothetical protein